MFVITCATTHTLTLTLTLTHKHTHTCACTTYTLFSVITCATKHTHTLVRQLVNSTPALQHTYVLKHALLKHDTFERTPC